MVFSAGSQEFEVTPLSVMCERCARNQARIYIYIYIYIRLLPARRRPQGLVVIGVCLSVRTASAQVCVPLGHSSLYLCLAVTKDLQLDIQTVVDIKIHRKMCTQIYNRMSTNGVHIF